MDTILTILTDEPIGFIKPRLYGHFAEHLGRCCYDGLWHVDASGVSGLRNDVVAALNALPVPLLRWPGGCYADHYHWQDGIGPLEQRPRRLGMSCGLQVEDDNSFGTHEFVDLCNRIGAEPYLAGNVGSGKPQELCDWVEYCNSSIKTSLVNKRRTNGADKPFGVRLWGVGNETWGCGGNFDAITYAHEYRRFATMLRHVDPNVELVLAGSGDSKANPEQLDAWNIDLIQTMRSHLKLVDHLSIHMYWIHGGPETEFSANEYYDLLGEAQRTEDFIVRTANMLREEAAERKIGIGLDEWGVWHPEAREWGPGLMTRRSPVTYEQANTLRDALAAGVMFEALHRQCAVLSFANLAQVVNVLQAPVMTETNRMWLTPTYYALALHAPHIGAVALKVAILQSDTLPDGTSAVTATASTSAHGPAVTLINRHFTNEALISIYSTGEQAYGQMLTASKANSLNSFSQPDNVRIADIAVRRNGPNQWSIELPAHSMATVLMR